MRNDTSFCPISRQISVMNKMSDIQRKVEEALASVDNIRQAQPNPFFYTRLEARMSGTREGFWERISKTVSRPAVAVLTLSLVIILNVAVVVQGTDSVSNVPELSEMASAEDLRASTSYYDIENNQP